MMIENYFKNYIFQDVPLGELKMVFTYGDGKQNNFEENVTSSEVRWEAMILYIMVYSWHDVVAWPT